MKTLRQIVELTKIDIIPDPDTMDGTVSDYANPKSEAERNFVGKHKDNLQVDLHPAFKSQEEQDAVFKGSKQSKDHSKIASYKDGEDAQVYEQAISFVQDNLTEENLEKFNVLLDEDYEAAVNFALDVATDLEDVE
jgi:hypothetical protein|tara:strand:+ start:365 stop:772 length:408 start_codon:yes stop_codon:yes gene_type:complete